MRIAFFVGGFPLISETFILRQIIGLIDLGHQVDIYAESMPEDGTPVHPSVKEYNLLNQTTYMDRYMPIETGYWQMPVFPITGETWLPGAEKPIRNIVRVLKAVPTFIRCFIMTPRLTMTVINSREYGYQALTLSSLYRLFALSSNSFKYDVLHAHFGTIGNTFRFVKKLWRKPFIVSFHGYDFSTWTRLNGVDVYIRLFDTVDAVTVNSEYTRNRLIDLGCPTAKLHKLHVGLNLTDFPFRERNHKPGETIKILAVARLVEIKGIEFSIRAIAKVREQYSNIRYDIIGEGILRSKLNELARMLKLENTVTFHGARDSNYVRQMMADAHLFLMTSVSVDGDQEGQGLALQEAQASGLPVIATNHGALSEGMLPEISGLLVPERDVGALTDRLVYLIRHPELWAEMGRAGRKFVEQNYDINKLNHQLINIYEQVGREFEKG